MISAQYPTWPDGLPQRRRSPSPLVFVVISLCGLVLGMLVRPLTSDIAHHHQTAVTRSTTSQVVASTVAPTVIPTVAPERFSLQPLQVLPATVNAGGVLTVTAAARTNSGSAASTVACTLKIEGLDVTAQVLQTSNDGTVTWQVTMPPGTPAGAYVVTVAGQWGNYGASRESNVVVK